MSTLAPPPPTRPPAPTRLSGGAPSPNRGRARKWLIIAAGGMLLLVLIPVVILGGAGNPPPCTTGGPPVGGGGGGPIKAGHFAAPLHLHQGRWYRVGATEYTGTGIGSDGTNLFDDPDSFAELSTLDSNPANLDISAFTFADADALDELPYMTGLRVRSGRKEMVLYKRDVGYGQGPDEQGPDGLIYRIDVFSSSAFKLGISKSPVDIELAPADGTGPVLGTTPGTGPTTNCTTGGGGSGPLPPTNPGQQVQIQPDGSATAPADAPQAVKLAVGAANQIYTKPYIWGGGHGSFDADGYDCSGTVSYVLHAIGLLSAPETSGQLESFGDPGPGKWITIYANSGHTWIVIAGRAFDTSHYGATTPAGTGPRWLADPTGNLGDGKQYLVRHPSGL